MKMNLFTKNKNVQKYDVAGMTADFERVKHVVETTTNPSQFSALDNLVNAFASKWKPCNTRKLYCCETQEWNQEYEDAVNYLKLKLSYEYEKVS